MFTAHIAAILRTWDLADAAVGADALLEGRGQNAKREAQGWFLLERSGVLHPLHGKLLTQIRDRDSNRHGVHRPGRVQQNAYAEVVKGQAIRLFGTHTKVDYVKDGDDYQRVDSEEIYEVTFRLGDDAVYGSYNLIYTGEIVSITEKTVTIQEPYGRLTRHRMNIFDFNWRNDDYDAERIAKHNHETSLYI